MQLHRALSTHEIFTYYTLCINGISRVIVSLHLVQNSPNSPLMNSLFQLNFTLSQ